MTAPPRTPTTRASLIARLRDPADAAGWSEFVAVYGPLVFDQVRRKGFSHADGEDLTQGIFTRVIRGLRTFHYSPERGRFRDWLGTIVRHEVIRAYRDRHPEKLLPPEAMERLPEEGCEPEWIDAFQTHLLAVALKECRPRFEELTWSAFEAVWLHDRTAEAVAAELGIPIETVYVSKSRVLKALAETIQQYTDDLPFFAV